MQITLTTPLRRMILHLEHILLTDALTFISSLPVAVSNSWPRILAFDVYVLPSVVLNIIGPSSVMAMVCSKWADRPPSCVTVVQPSSKVTTS